MSEAGKAAAPMQSLDPSFPPRALYRSLPQGVPPPPYILSNEGGLVVCVAVV